LNETTNLLASTATTRVAQMFPTLTPAQVERIASHGSRRATESGEVLYDVGALPVPFIVVSRGAIELLHPHEGAEKLIQALGPGQFSGELNLLSGRRALARARVSEPGEVIVLEREELLRLVQTDFDLSEILMRAFILRRVALMEEGLGDVVLIGSKFCSGTLRVREFLTRNAHPYAYFDLEQDAEVQHLLDQFQVSIDDIPVLICRGERVLRNPSRSPIAWDSTNPSTTRMFGTFS
jgi:thioredoxin reductase (NADPH)